jgi:RimJ/RimL family protein N-acetyltransferase
MISSYTLRAEPTTRCLQPLVDGILGAMDPAPIVLEGEHARLEPLAESHAADLFAVACDPDVWRYMPRATPETIGDVRAMIAEALERARDGSEVPFAIIARETGRAVGSTRYIDIRRAHRGLEIGWTWIGREWQRTALNTQCKRLLLEHAFETLGALRVQLKTDARNVRSQRAIERIGAAREGVLRAHMILPDGFVRDSVMYSIVAADWPRVTARLSELERAR